MNTHRIEAFRDKRVLLLQGPVGPFFWRLSRDLRWAGAQVCKVNFNGGDWLFYPAGAVAFRGKMNEWPTFFSRLLEERQINVVLFLGDCRPIHAAIHDIAIQHGVEVGVFEEGYIRPDYITLDKAGVNGFSNIPRTPISYLNTPASTHAEPRPIGNVFRYVVLWAMLYYFFSALLSPVFRHYRHHRPLNPLEGLPWLRALWRKAYYRVVERGVEKSLRSSRSGDYFLVPLQVHNDAQIHVHSPFGSVTEFIGHVMQSFALHAPEKAALVIKHHPLDRGYREYTRYILHEARRLGILERTMAIHDQHLPTLLEHARGVVVVNSTVGLSSVHHGVPVKVCGCSIYDMKGLTFQGPLDEFWNSAHNEDIDMELYRRFRGYLVGHCQLNGNFYKRLDVPGSYSGLVWGADSSMDDLSAPKSCKGINQAS